MMAAGVAFLIAGIFWPQSAETFLRALLVVVAVGFVVDRAYEAKLPLRTTQDSYSPFDGENAARTVAVAPRALQGLTATLAAADDAQLARRTAMPGVVRQMLVEAASRRLTQRHGLRVGEPAHHAIIRSLVSEPTWFLIRPRGSEHGYGAGTIPLGDLVLILDDLERL